MNHGGTEVEPSWHGGQTIFGSPLSTTWHRCWTPGEATLDEANTATWSATACDAMIYRSPKQGFHTQADHIAIVFLLLWITRPGSPCSKFRARRSRLCSTGTQQAFQWCWTPALMNTRPCRSLHGWRHHWGFPTTKPFGSPLSTTWHRCWTPGEATLDEANTATWSATACDAMIYRSPKQGFHTQADHIAIVFLLLWITRPGSPCSKFRARRSRLCSTGTQQAFQWCWTPALMNTRPCRSLHGWRHHWGFPTTQTSAHSGWSHQVLVTKPMAILFSSVRPHPYLPIFWTRRETADGSHASLAASRCHLWLRGMRSRDDRRRRHGARHIQLAMICYLPSRWSHRPIPRLCLRHKTSSCQYDH